jgi:hypothetical protein
MGVKMKILKNCENIFGKISPQTERRIKKYINNPNYDNWDDIQSIIIKPEGMTTIWQAMIKSDPTFPKKGRSEDFEGNIIKEWERIPMPLELLRAIKEETI